MQSMAVSDVQQNEHDVGFAGPGHVWARMNATAHSTGDHLRAWVEAFTGTNSSSTTAATIRNPTA